MIDRLESDEDDVEWRFQVEVVCDEWRHGMDFLTNLAERRPVEDEEDFWQINSIEFQS
jgi:hypothetical protein